MIANIKLKTVLDESILLLKTSGETLRHSIEICSTIGIKTEYTMEELDHFEALTARFARVSDICTQKVIRTVIQLLREDHPTFIDKAAFAEKIGMIKNAEELIIIRDLRNSIAHEYLLEALYEIFASVLKYSPILECIIESVISYAESRKF